MDRLQRVFVCGLGALGAMYVDRLSRAPVESVRVIADPERIGRYRQSGVRVNGVALSLDLLSPEEPAPPADLILVAVKWHQLNEAIRAIRPFVGEDTVILSLLNGIESETVIGRALGREKLLYSFVVETDALRRGQDISYKTLGTIVFGEADNTAIAPKVAAVRELFERAAIPFRIPSDMLRELWWKFMLNVGVNQTSAVMRAPYGAFQTFEEAREALRMACREVVRVAEKEGVVLTDQDVESYFPILDRLSPGKKTSMLQDVEAHRKTEVEIFAGTVVALGRRHGVPTPVNEMLFNMIRTIEQSYPAP